MDPLVPWTVVIGVTAGLFVFPFLFAPFGAGKSLNEKVNDGFWNAYEFVWSILMYFYALYDGAYNYVAEKLDRIYESATGIFDYF